MQLEQLVLTKLAALDLDGVRVLDLTCELDLLHVQFELGDKTISYKTLNETLLQIVAVFFTKTKTPCTDEMAILQFREWAKYLNTKLYPLVQQCQLELETLAAAVVEEIIADDELAGELANVDGEAFVEGDLRVDDKIAMLVETNATDSVNEDVLTTDDLAILQQHELKQSNQDELQSLLEQTQDELAATQLELATIKAQQLQFVAQPLPTHKKVLRVIWNILFYLGLVTMVLGVSAFSLQEPDAPPRDLFGYSMMTVLTRSMEPEIPARSLIVINGNIHPNYIVVGDVVTYLIEGNTTMTHRVIEIQENFQGTGERGFRLQGDNNSLPDREIVRAVNVIGVVIFDNLLLGQGVFFIQDNIILVVIFIALGVALVMVVKKFFFFKQEQEALVVGDDEPSNELPLTANQVIVNDEQHPRPGRKRWYKNPVHIILMVFILGIFGYSIYRVVAYHSFYRAIEAASAQLRNQYVQTVVVDDEENDLRSTRTFLTIDWEGLFARNSDVVAWLHVPGTNINYPVVAGLTNEEYLRLNFDRQYSLAGSIFLEEGNDNGFNDLNTIIYGHNMLNGSKFSDVHAFINGQIRVQDVPYIYLYLPAGQVLIYQIIGAHLTDIHSLIYYLPVWDLVAFHELIAAQNQLTVDFVAEYDARMITLSTCAEVGASPIRSVIFGMLVEEREIW